ncbi:MAG: hypothetical protein ACXWBV_18485, partial [Usitatibacter sp.]
MAATMEKNIATQAPRSASHTITPAMAHLRCTRLKCSTLSQCLLRQAHSLPFAPSTKTMMMLTKGTNARSAMKVLFPMPQIQLRRKAPQFHRSISGGMGEAVDDMMMFYPLPGPLPRERGNFPLRRERENFTA